MKDLKLWQKLLLNEVSQKDFDKYLKKSLSLESSNNKPLRKKNKKKSK